MRILFFLLSLAALAWSDIGNVGALKGSATLKRGTADLEIKSGMTLEVKDTIITSAKSRVQVILKDDTVITIGPDSSFVFDAYKFGGKDDSEVSMHINRGFFRSVTGMIGKLAPERFKVKTASATIGIRGTDFSAQIAEEKETIACYKGQITVLLHNGHQPLIVDAGMIMDLAQGKAKLKKLGRTEGKKGEKRDIVSTEQIADVTQQDIQRELDKKLEDPSVSFHDRPSQ